MKTQQRRLESNKVIEREREWRFVGELIYGFEGNEEKRREFGVRLRVRDGKGQFKDRRTSWHLYQTKTTKEMD
jgi:hypothetical protein